VIFLIVLCTWLYSAIVVVDMEEKRWRTIRKPGGAKISIHQA
jgi:hypothetical protein